MNLDPSKRASFLKLTADLQDADPNVRFGASTRLTMRSEDWGARAVIVGAQREPWPLMRVQAVATLTCMRRRQATLWLVATAMAASDPTMVWAALCRMRLLRIRKRAVVDGLLEDPDPLVRYGALEYMVALGYYTIAAQEAAERLIEEGVYPFEELKRDKLAPKSKEEMIGNLTKWREEISEHGNAPKPRRSRKKPSRP